MERDLPPDLVALLTGSFPVDANRLTPRTTFAELGMDSLATMELLVVSEGVLDRPLTEAAMRLTSCSTLAEAVDALGCAASPAEPEPVPHNP
ncbi:acyl carrier protein [Kitasatospora sp. NPDC096077]|uniref:acyl carrier protein n=1 Tax=Kitasatospora sp. NPDC096077 TaxID=3155544 RepID=UPI00331CCD09